MTDRTTSLLLKATVDQSAADQGVQALQSLQKASLDTATAFDQINKSGGEAVNEIRSLGDIRDRIASLRDVFQSTTESVDENADAVAKLREEYIAAADAAAKVKPPSPDGSGFSVSTLRTTGRALDQLGLSGVGRPIQQLGDIGIITKQLGELNDAFKGLPGILGDVATQATATAGGFSGVLAVAGPLALAIGAIALAFKLFITDTLAPANKALDDARASVDAYYKAIEKGTTDSLQKQLDDLENQKKAQDEKVKTLNDALASNTEQTIKQFGAVDGALALAAEKAGAFGGGIKNLQSDLDDAKKQSGDLATQIDGVKRAMGSSEVAANDAADAEKKLTAERDKAADAAIAQAKANEQLVQTGTSKGIEAQVNDIKTEMQSIGEALNSGGLSPAKIDELTGRLNDLQHQEIALTDTILPAVQAREAETKATEDAKKASEEYQKTLTNLEAVSSEISKLESARAAQLKQEAEDEARATQRAAVEQDYATRIAAAKRVEAEEKVQDQLIQADQQALDKYNASRSQIINNEFDTELKAYQNYIDSEKDATRRFNLDRLHTLESAQQDLKSLAASGDVAGFVQKSDQVQLQLKQAKDNEDLADTQRREAFERQIADARAARDKQLQDLQVSFEREKAARDAAAQQRIQDIEQQGKEANTRSAQLEQELNTIREQWRKDDLKRQRDAEEQSYEERLQLQVDKQNEMLAQQDSFWNQMMSAQAAAQQAQLSYTQALAQSITSDNQALTDQRQGEISGLDTGISYVPQDNYRASLHLGERVLTARENQAYMSGSSGGGNTYHIAVNNTVGDIATKSMLDDYQNETIDGIQSALMQSAGKGS